MRRFIGPIPTANVLSPGTLICSNGEIHVGKFINDRLEGEGFIRLRNGSIFEGYFINGSPNGHSSLHDTDGITTVGQFNDGLYRAENPTIHYPTVLPSDSTISDCELITALKSTKGKKAMGIDVPSPAILKFALADDCNNSSFQRCI